MIMISSLTGQASASTYIVIVIFLLFYAHCLILIFYTIKQEQGIANRMQVL